MIAQRPHILANQARLEHPAELTLRAGHDDRAHTLSAVAGQGPARGNRLVVGMGMDRQKGARVCHG